MVGKRVKEGGGQQICVRGEGKGKTNLYDRRGRGTNLRDGEREGRPRQPNEKKTVEEYLVHSEPIGAGKKDSDPIKTIIEFPVNEF